MTFCIPKHVAGVFICFKKIYVIYVGFLLTLGSGNRHGCAILDVKMPPKKQALSCFIEQVLIPEKQREGYNFRNGFAALYPEASRRFKVSMFLDFETLCMTVHHCLHGETPRYLADLVTPSAAATARTGLRSATSGSVAVPRTMSSRRPLVRCGRTARVEQAAVATSLRRLC